MDKGNLYLITFISNGERSIKVAAKSEFYAKKKAHRYLVGTGKYLSVDIVKIEELDKAIIF